MSVRAGVCVCARAHACVCFKAGSPVSQASDTTEIHYVAEANDFEFLISLQPPPWSQY